ncbi:MAG: metallophosphoesterase [Acidimicrobiia bacterium]|nr:metallophosphoesterase [Acidimicrobiia bacterium]
MPATPTALIAQLTDTHVVEPGCTEELWVDNTARVREAVVSINDEVPAMSAVLATGDLTNGGRPGEFEMLAECLAPLDAQLLPLAGNHDHRGRLRATFPNVPWADAEHASWIVAIDGVRLVGLDSTRPGEPGAAYDTTRDRWLRTQLRSSFAGPTILALHHPPFVTGIEWMDRSGFLGLDRLAAALTQHPVDLVVCGHMHRPIIGAVAGIPAQVGLSTVQSVALDLSVGSRPAVIRDPSGYVIHRIHGRDIVSHTRYIATGHEPLVPTWAAEMP